MSPSPVVSSHRWTKTVISKLYGTQLYVRKVMEDETAAAGVDSVESNICNVFLERWSEMWKRGYEEKQNHDTRVTKKVGVPKPLEK